MLFIALPRKVAFEMLFTGDPITAAEAANWGMINQVVPNGTVLDAALALAERITVNAPLSVQVSKRVAYGVDDGVMWLIPITLGLLAVASTITVVQRILVVRRQSLDLTPPAE